MKTITNVTYPPFALFVLACFALSPQVRATCQEGCLTNFNSVLGDDALITLTTGSNNTGIGFNVLFNDTIGSDNTANGTVALCSNTTGYSNTADGDSALFYNSTGAQNTAIGFQALFFNRTGSDNTANGVFALASNATGTNNIALGNSAGINLTTGSNNIYIGNPGNHGESGKIRIGTAGTQTATFLAGISGVTVPAGVGVIVGTNGQLGTVVSSARFKDAIKPMDKTSETILALKPVTFRYKRDRDPAGIPQFGLVAEDVEKVNPDLVARDEQGKPYTVRYEAVNAMLLNEFLKEHRKVEEQQATITRLESADAKHEAKIAHQQKQIEALTAGLQKVSVELELSKGASQMVANDP